MTQAKDLVDIVLLVCGTFTVLSIAHKICNLPVADERCPQGAARAISERTKLESAIAASESLLTIGIKKTKYYVEYYPYLWETLLVEYPRKQRAVGLFALDALVTSSCYLPTKLTRQILDWKSSHKSRPSVRIILEGIVWDWALNILLATAIGGVVVAVTDEVAEDKAKFAAICFGSRILGGILVYILSRHGTLQGGTRSGTLSPLAAYTMQSALFSEVTNMAAHSDYPGITNFVQFHQSQSFMFTPKPHHPCAVCNHNPPHLTASGFQISGALAVIRLLAKGYMDYLSYGNEDVSDFFGFQQEAPHPTIPMFLTPSIHKEEITKNFAGAGAWTCLTHWLSPCITHGNTLMLRRIPDPPPELEIDQLAYDKMQLITQYETERFLLITITGLNIRLAKFVFNYFPYVWNSGDYGKTLITRTMWFAAIDNCMEVAVAIPFFFLSSLLTGGNPVLSVLDQIVEMVFHGLLAAIATYLIIYATENFGVNSIMEGQLALNALGLFGMAFYFRYMIALDHERLPDNEVGQTVKALAKDVGYSSDKIYVDKRDPEPNAYYSSALFSNIIIITESLLLSLDPLQVTSVVAHELGHWNYCHPLYTYIGYTAEMVAVGCFWTFAYGSSKLISIFQLDPDVHPFIPVYLAFHFIWPPVRDIIQGIFNVFKTHFEFVADDYSCGLWSPKHLRQALVKISTKVKSFPLLDNWFTAWFIGHPSILERIRRIDMLLENE